MPNMRKSVGAGSLGSSKRSVLGGAKKSAKAHGSSADAIAEVYICVGNTLNIQCMCICVNVLSVSADVLLTF